MEATQVLKRPVLTEKSTHATDANRYTFEIDSRATKRDVKQAVEEIYKVRVLGVATQNRKGRLRRNRFGHWRADAMKQAVVKVHPDDKLELL